MKLFRYTRLIAALTVAAFISGCGGGNNDDDRSFVTVRQLESGSAGFWVMGSGGDFRIISNGTAGNDDIVNNKHVSGNLYAPLPAFKTPTGDDNYTQNPWNVPEGWEETGPIAEQSKILSGRLVDGGQTVAEINSMLYSIEEGGNRAHLQMIFTPGNLNTFNETLANFFGCITSNNVPSLGNVSSAWVDTTNKRVIVPSAAGAAVHLWFDFTSGRCLVQMIATSALDTYQWVDEDDMVHRVEGGISETTALFTTEGAIFRKIVN